MGGSSIGSRGLDESVGGATDVLNTCRMSKGAYKRHSNGEVQIVPDQVIQQAQIVAEKVATRQNTIYLMWEGTQALVAISLVMATIYSSLFSAEVPETLKNALFIVMGFYFGRTNHARPVIKAEPPSL